MSILKRYTDAIDKKDEATMNELLHDDFKFTMHKLEILLEKLT
tara:strand:+ start:120 stop:248 length:129 start_codon:yes stop_codon:yes gene_type:complete